jgi:hypothetical protein
MIKANQFTREGKALVAKTRAGEDLKEAIRRSVGAIGGWDKVIAPGDTILVKPNFKGTYEKLDKGNGVETREFYQAKIQTAEFYFERLLPRTKGYAETMLAPVKATMQMPIDHFAFS